MVRLALVMFSIGLWCLPSYAQTFELKDVPPLHQLKVFQSDTDPDHYLILGKDGIYQDAGRWYVLDWDHGQVTSPKLKPESYFWYSGGFDFRFESGLWLYISVHSHMPDATAEIIPNGLIDPNHGREPLHEVKATPELFTQLNLMPQIAPAALEKLQRISEAREEVSSKKRIALDNAVTLMVLKYGRDQYETVRKLEKSLKDGGLSPIHTLEIMGDQSSTFLIFGFQSQVDGISKAIAEAGLSQSLSTASTLDISAASVPVEHLNDYYALDILEQLRNYKTTLTQVEAEIPHSNQKELDAKVTLLVSKLWSVNSFYDWASEAIARLRHYENSTSAQESITKNFLNPANQLTEQTFALLHKIQSPAAREAILGLEDKSYSLLGYLEKDAGPGLGNYFQVWLNLLKEKTFWANQATAEELKEARVAYHSGGMLQELGFLSVTMKDFRPKNLLRLPALRVDENMLPLSVLGLRDSAVVRAQLAQFIVEMDKLAEWQKTRIPHEYDDPIRGNLTLARVIQGLAYDSFQYTRSPIAEALGYSKALYYRQAMMVVTELLNTSRITITNEATFLTLMNTAFGLQRNVQNIFGAVPNQGEKSSPETDALTRALVDLQRAIQVRLVRAIYLGRGHGDCEGALLPK